MIFFVVENSVWILVWYCTDNFNLLNISFWILAVSAVILVVFELVVCACLMKQMLLHHEYEYNRDKKSTYLYMATLIFKGSVYIYIAFYEALTFKAEAI